MQNKKYALISGASSGIGKAIAFKFAEQGISLLLCARRVEKLNEIATEIKSKFEVEVLCFEVDVRDKTQVDTLFSNLANKEIAPYFLINNAGLAAGKDKIQEGVLSDWEQMIDTNVKGLLYMTRRFLPKMIARNEGHIILIGSTAGHWVYPEGNVYNATKFAVRALNEGINMDLAGTNIKCCSIDPGACETEFSMVRFNGDNEKAAAVYKGYEPLHPADVADATWYVCNTPPHVNITNMVIYPTAQRGVTMIDRK